MVNLFSSAKLKIAATLLFLVSFGGYLSGQETKLFAMWTDSTLSISNSAADVAYMSEEEKKVIFYINLCRINPPLFASTYLNDYLKEKEIKKDKVVKDLIDDLENSYARGLLLPSEALTIVARAQAKDMGNTGRTGHNSSDGKSFQERISELALTFQGINENANYGQEFALDIVIDLLIDRDVPNVGHRRNILDDDMKFAGVAIEPHKKWRFNCVQDFAGSKLNPQH